MALPEDKSAPIKAPTISEKANGLYRDLFVKYLRYLYIVEGSAFISDLYRQQAEADGLRFTDGEWKTLEQLSKEATP